MTPALFYIFYAIAFIAGVFSVFSDNYSMKNFALMTFLLSLSGIFSLINSGYISFVILILTAGYYSFRIINDKLLNLRFQRETEVGNGISITQLMAVCVLGSMLASLLGSTMWQGKVYLYKQVTLANLGELIGGDYFVFFLVIFVSFFLPDSNSKQNGNS